MTITKKMLVLPLLGGALQMGVVSEAAAGFAPQFLGTSSAGGGNTSFNYNLLFTTEPSQESLISGTGTVSPGSPGSADFLTLVDVRGLVSAIAGANFVVTTQNTGILGPMTMLGDSAALPNVTFRYTGPTLTVDTILGGFSLISTFAHAGLGNYSSQRTDAAGIDSGTKIGEAGVAVLPVPEPSTFALLAAGLGMIGTMLIRRTKVG